MTGTPQQIPTRTFAALCDILHCSLKELFEPFVDMQGAVVVAQGPLSVVRCGRCWRAAAAPPHS
ncbi:hypothetical protein GCM10023215_58130 [Pseudonocardia yuanmonensis]|uniref:HTH cro/C1-type domain-containing protein n=1 Tax=Pseudonocardia yuanmonensis TaxID=1095914 RepID=A0ABP8XIW5_9PSEU